MLKFRSCLASLAMVVLACGAVQAQTPEREHLETRLMARLKLAAEYYGQGQLGQALRELNGAQDIASDYAPLQNLLGVVNMDLNRHDEAERAFQKALKLERDNPDIHNNYGWFLCVSGNPNKGIEWLTKAYTNPLYTTPEKALYNAGKCARMQKDTGRATEYFAKALMVAPSASAVVYEMASMQFDAGDYAKALQLLERFHTMDTETPQSLWLALRAEQRQGNALEVESYGSKLVAKISEQCGSGIVDESEFLMMFVDMEWEHAHNSMGAPVSIGVVLADGRSAYAEWDTPTDVSDWTAMHVLPRLRGGVFAPKNCPYMPLDKVVDILGRHSTTIWVSDDSVQQWLLLLGLESQVFPGAISEHEQIQCWWARQHWANGHEGYHAWEDACGMLDSARAMGWIEGPC